MHFAKLLRVLHYPFQGEPGVTAQIAGEIPDNLRFAAVDCKFAFCRRVRRRWRRQRAVISLDS